MNISSSDILTIVLKGFLGIISLYFLSTRAHKFLKHDRGQTLFKLVITIAVWGTILGLTLTPSLAYSISKSFGLGDNLNTLIFLGFVLTFAIIFRLLRAIEHQETSLSEIVSRLAVNEAHQTQPKEKVDEDKKRDAQEH